MASETVDDLRHEAAVERGVGPVLQAGLLADAIVAAIEEENDDVVVEDQGAYLRVFVPNVCRVSRAGIEKYLGRSIRFPGTLEEVIPSFTGKVSFDEDGARWELKTARP
jgi:toluene monooxygenase system protein D